MTAFDKRLKPNCPTSKSETSMPAYYVATEASHEYLQGTESKCVRSHLQTNHKIPDAQHLMKGHSSR